MDVYYNGDFGDFGNCDWFDALHHSLGVVEEIEDLYRCHQTGLMECTLVLACGTRLKDCVIKRAPNQRRHVDPHMVGRQLVALTLDKTRDVMRSCDTFTARLEEVEVGGDGRCHPRPDIPVWAIRKEIDDIMMSCSGAAEQIIQHTIRDMGAQIGIKMMEQLVASTGLTNRVTRFNVGGYNIARGGGPGIPLEDLEEPTEGDLLLDFFSKRNS